MKFILFCVDHFNTLGILRTLSERGYIPIVILLEESNKHGYLIQSSKYKPKIHTVKTLEEGLELLLTRYGNEQDKPFLLTGMDRIEMYLDQHYEELVNKFYFFHAGSAGKVTHMMNKEIQRGLAESCGLDIIKSEIVKVGEKPTTLSYPIITKAIDSTIIGWKNLVHICRNEEELIQAYTECKVENIMLQEYIEKKNEISLLGVSINNGNDIYIPLQLTYHRFTPEAYGTYIKLNKFKNAKLKKHIANLFKTTGYNGIFEIEFILDKYNKLHFLEINFRISAWIHGFSDCGVNLPLIFAKSVKSCRIDSSDENIKKTPFNGMIEPTDFMLHVLHGNTSIWKWLKEFKSCDTWFYYDKYDKAPFWNMVFNNLSIKKLINHQNKK